MAQKTHAEIKAALQNLPARVKRERVHILFGDKKPTPALYDVRRVKTTNGRLSYGMQRVSGYLPGDGTVTTQSALYQHDTSMKIESAAIVQQFVQVEHATICQDPSVLEYLRGVLSAT